LVTLPEVAINVPTITEVNLNVLGAQAGFSTTQEFLQAHLNRKIEVVAFRKSLGLSKRIALSFKKCGRYALKTPKHRKMQQFR